RHSVISAPQSGVQRYLLFKSPATNLTSASSNAARGYPVLSISARIIDSADLSNGNATAKWSASAAPKYFASGTIASSRSNCPSSSAPNGCSSRHVLSSALEVFVELDFATIEYVGTTGCGYRARKAWRADR